MVLPPSVLVALLSLMVVATLVPSTSQDVSDPVVSPASCPSYLWEKSFLSLFLDMAVTWG